MYHDPQTTLRGLAEVLSAKLEKKITANKRPRRMAKVSTVPEGG